MPDKHANSIGALWPSMSGPSPLPTDAELAAQSAAIRRGLPAVRHKIDMRFEQMFGTWRVTFTEGGRVLHECTFEHDHKLEEAVSRGRGFTCLADRQAFEEGVRRRLGIATLQLDAEQYAALQQPR